MQETRCNRFTQLTDFIDYPNRVKRFFDLREEYKIPLNPPFEKGGSKSPPLL
jgi:hypothetical protein